MRVAGFISPHVLRFFKSSSRLAFFDSFLYSISFFISTSDYKALREEGVRAGARTAAETRTQRTPPLRRAIVGEMTLPTVELGELLTLFSDVVLQVRRIGMRHSARTDERASSGVHLADGVLPVRYDTFDTSYLATYVVVCKVHRSVRFAVLSELAKQLVDCVSLSADSVVDAVKFFGSVDPSAFDDLPLPVVLRLKTCAIRKSCLEFRVDGVHVDGFAYASTVAISTVSLLVVLVSCGHLLAVSVVKTSSHSFFSLSSGA